MTILCVSCGTFTVKEGSRSEVVWAEYTAEQSLAVFDSFLKWEYKNHQSLVTEAPAVVSAANLVRANGKRWIQDLRAATELYKHFPTADNFTRLKLARDTLEQALAEIRAQTSK